MDEACVARDDDLDHLVLAVAHGGLVQEEEHGLEEDDQHVADLEAEHGVPDVGGGDGEDGGGLVVVDYAFFLFFSNFTL
ncbi:hypothetical protein ERO13_A05G011901v2 [Gossypium hirsutum]|uniref:Uncharacterized protein n=2 Tax=Gossypium TaxID=3633 RepID=A0A5J5VHY0_GOSBA|nr:hypothetical protein ES319_A05G013200v1 [Gossypium barbadense]KAG4197243.1 hypothetical protein ERO13_A05G011901v2 [Gossypium hirsutum]TYI24856.1 hypothetical protein ES332_A05G013800v1 [Gossypium tomentosum]